MITERQKYDAQLYRSWRKIGYEVHSIADAMPWGLKTKIGIKLSWWAVNEQQELVMRSTTVFHAYDVELAIKFSGCETEDDMLNAMTPAMWQDFLDANWGQDAKD